MSQPFDRTRTPGDCGDPIAFGGMSESQEPEEHPELTHERPWFVLVETPHEHGYTTKVLAGGFDTAEQARAEARKQAFEFKSSARAASKRNVFLVGEDTYVVLYRKAMLSYEFKLRVVRLIAEPED